MEFPNVKAELRFRYGLELSYEMLEKNRWSKQKYIEMCPEFKHEACIFCDALNPDFHHILPQYSNARYVYHAENLVLLCSKSNNAITRNKDPKLNAACKVCQEK